MEDWSGRCSVERDRTQDAKAVTGVREGCGGRGVITEQGPQGGGQQPEAYANSGPTRCPPHNHIVLTEEGQDFQHEQWFIFWIGPHQKTSMPCASPRSHFAISGPLCQAVLRPKVHVDVCGPTTAGAMLMSRAHVTAKSQAHVPSWFCT